MLEFIKEMGKLLNNVFKEKDKYDRTHLLREVNRALEAIEKDDLDQLNASIGRLLSAPVEVVNPKTGE